MTLDEMARDQRHWSTIEALILSEQIPASRIAELRRDYPRLAAWLDRKRVAQNH